MIDVPLFFYAVFAFIFVGAVLSSMILFARAKLVGNSLCKVCINEGVIKLAKGGSTLLASLSAHGIAIPSPCGGKATCKQCKVKVIGGEILETDKATFTPKELKEGWRLSCQCKVKQDLAVIIPPALLSLKEFKGRVVSNENVATFIKELIVEIPEEIAYVPGDYLQFHVPPYQCNTSQWKQTMQPQYYADWEKFHLFDREIQAEEGVIRAYSMASHPSEKKLLRFNIRIASPPLVKGQIAEDIPWGICSSYLFSLKPEDEATLSGPFGESHMIDDARDVIFLIGGAGSSFGRSHILDLFYRKKTQRNVALWYGARSLKENIYQEEFEALSCTHKNFSYRLVLSEPSQADVERNWPVKDPVKTNYLFKAFEVGQLSKMDEPEACLYYVCGPPLHNKSVMALLDQYGVPRDSIILDDFGS